ncbi:MAG: ferritin-like domain-containing protein [Nitrososphaeraceae archaeon]
MEYVLLNNTKNYHWNVVDPTFNDLHKFLDRLYELLQYELFEIIVNELAERIISIGVKSIGSLKNL